MIENAIDFSDVGDVDDIPDDDKNGNYDAHNNFNNNNEPLDENFMKKDEEEEEEVPVLEPERIRNVFRPMHEHIFEQYSRSAPRTAAKRMFYPRPVQHQEGMTYFLGEGSENTNFFPNARMRGMLGEKENSNFRSYHLTREMLGENENANFFPGSRGHELFERNENAIGGNENAMKRGMFFVAQPEEFGNDIELVRDTDLPNFLPSMNRGYESVSEDGDNVFEDFSDDVIDGAYGNKRESIPKTNDTRSTANITASLYALPANLTGFT